jgi:hypothetical protein
VRQPSLTIASGKFHMSFKSISLLVVLSALFPGTSLYAQDKQPAIANADREAVIRAATDYIEGFYEGDSAKLARSVRADMSKYGFWADSTGKYTGERMTFPEAITYAKRVKARNRPVPAAWPKAVTVFEVQDQTASAKVTAWWGTDYLLLGKYDGRWMISDILWQGPLKR